MDDAERGEHGENEGEAVAPRRGAVAREQEVVNEAQHPRLLPPLAAPFLRAGNGARPGRAHPRLGESTRVLVALLPQRELHGAR